MTNNPFLEIARIVEDWEDGHDGEFPMLLCYDPEANEKPFLYRKGCGFGSFGGRLTLKELCDKKFIFEFDHPESKWAFEVVQQALAKGSDDHQAGRALMEAYTERFNQPPAPPVF
jgi:hypothetical protein